MTKESIGLPTVDHSFYLPSLWTLKKQQIYIYFEARQIQKIKIPKPEK
jgi:hypothetical protein